MQILRVLVISIHLTMIICFLSTNSPAQYCRASNEVTGSLIRGSPKRFVPIGKQEGVPVVPGMEM